MAKGEFAKESFTQLPPWAKGVVAVLVVGGVAVIGYTIYKKIKDIGKDKPSKLEDRGWNQEFDELNSNPNTKATMSKADMLATANALFAAMDGYGTDEEAVVSQFTKIKNNADFAGVTAAYGVRELSSGKWNPEPNFSGTLSAALTNELSQTWKDQINKDLLQKGIKYKL